MEAIIFDCDGVLVDSEIIASRVVADLVGRHLPGGLPTEEFMVRFAGRKDDEILEELAAESGIAFPDDMLARIEAAIDDALIAELRPVPGVAEALAGIDLPMAVASNSPRDRIMRSLDRAGIRHLFGGRICSADEVARPKPAPDVYRLAARLLDTDPRRCLAVEDSPFGVTAAAAAGMTVIGFLGGAHIMPGHDIKLLAAGAIDLAHGMAALPDLVRRRLAA